MSILDKRDTKYPKIHGSSHADSHRNADLSQRLLTTGLDEQVDRKEDAGLDRNMKEEGPPVVMTASCRFRNPQRRWSSPISYSRVGTGLFQV